MTQACFTAGFADGAHAGAALYEGWCTGEDHRFTDLLSTWTQCRRTKQKGIRKPSGEDMKKTLSFFSKVPSEREAKTKHLPSCACEHL